MAKWALIALIAPEVVLVCAYFQWLQAKRLCDQLETVWPENELLPGNEETPGDQTQRTLSSLPTYLVATFRRVGHRISPPANSWFARRCSQKRRIPLVYGYYAVMGGFAVNTSTFRPFSPQLGFSFQQRMTITCPGLIVLANDGVLLKVDPETIKDKSKADVLAKALVIIQVTWMVVQVRAKPH
jgi:hypothetical protein